VLGVILNCSTLLGRRLEDPAARAELLEIQLAAEQAVGLSRALLAVAGGDVADPEPLSVADLSAIVGSACATSLGEQVERHLDVGNDPLVCLADRSHLERIVTALVTNADDAMPAGGSLTITLRRSAGERRLLGSRDPPAPEVVLEIADTGCGMTAEVAGRAVEPFYTTKPRTTGTGLGLAVVRGLVHSNAGEVAIRSTPGVGTTVTVVLPGGDLAAHRVPAQHASPRAAP
jgi:signal transduction histidine kinase